MNTTRRPIIAPSVLAADFAELGKAVDLINASTADWVHCDIMDGHFVPNLSFGLPVLKAIHQRSSKPLDVHLMIANPDRYLEAFRDAGAEVLTVHWEACPHLHRTVTRIRALGMRPGVAINPHTPVHFLDAILPEVDLVNLMSVNPGFAGQSFIEASLQKTRHLSKMIDERGTKTLIEIDGGVSDDNAQDLVLAGADVLVAGSFIFKAEDPHRAIADLKKKRERRMNI